MEEKPKLKKYRVEVTKDVFLWQEVMAEDEEHAKEIVEDEWFEDMEEEGYEYHVHRPRLVRE